MLSIVAREVLTHTNIIVLHSSDKNLALGTHRKSSFWQVYFYALRKWDFYTCLCLFLLKYRPIQIQNIGKYLSTLIAILTKIPYFPINLQFKILIIHSKLKFKTYFWVRRIFLHTAGCICIGMYHRLFWRYIVNCADIYAGGKDPSWIVPARHPDPENSQKLLESA